MNGDGQPVAEVETAVLHAPARAESRGGDFHHIHRAGSVTLALVGDVTGKGEAAAPYADQLKQWTADSAPASGGDPAALLEALNACVYEADDFPHVAAAALAIDAEQWSATWAYAGHLPPVSLDTGLPLDGATPGMLLGYEAHCGSGTAQRRPLRPGEGFVLYTDGLEDVVAPGGGRFGTARVTHTLARQLRNVSAQEVVEGLKRAACEFSSNDLYDDICIAALRVS